MGIKYRENYVVPFFESDVFSNMRISSMMSLALQMSGVQSSALGRSDVWLSEHYNLFWAVVEYEITIHQLPKFSQKITIETEATSYNKFFCYRHFWIRDEEGNLLVELATTWVLMDKDDRKVARVADEIVAPYQSEKISKIVRPHKYEKLSENFENTAYNVRFSDLDMNGHVNNSIYYDWAADTVDMAFRKNHVPHKVYIKYNQEVRYGETANVKLSWNDLTSIHKINDTANEVEIHWVSKNNQAAKGEQNHG